MEVATVVEPFGGKVEATVVDESRDDEGAPVKALCPDEQPQAVTPRARRAAVSATCFTHQSCHVNPERRVGVSVWARRYVPLERVRHFAITALHSRPGVLNPPVG
jgi:hypothetical protein